MKKPSIPPQRPENVLSRMSSISKQPERAPQLIVPTAIGILRDAVHWAHQCGALANDKWLRHLTTLIPSHEDLETLSALAVRTLAGEPAAAENLNHQLWGLSQRFRIPSSPETQSATTMEREMRDHKHDTGMINLEGLIKLRVAAAVASYGSPSIALINSLAIEAVTARLSLVNALVPAATRALVEPAGIEFFVGMLDNYEKGPLGPDDGPPHRPQKSLIEPDLLQCLESAGTSVLRKFGLMSSPRISYHLKTISAPKACPGTQVTLAGRRFGSTAGEVIFPAAGGPLNTVSTAPTSWSDTRIDVIIPDTATSGQLWLRLPFPNEISVCGITLTLPAVGISDVLYEGGVGSVDDLRLQKRQAALLASRPLAIEWAARPSSAHIVLWIDNVSVGRVVDVSGLAAVGTFTWTPPPGEMLYSLKLWAHHCSTWSCRALDFKVNAEHDISIRAIEVTQVVQFLKDASVPLSEEDNSIPMVQGKPTMVRVYLQTNQTIPLSAEQHCVDLYGYDEHGVLVPSPLTASAREIHPSTLKLADLSNTDDDARDQISSTANFLIPDAWLAVARSHGRNWAVLRLKAELVPVGPGVRAVHPSTSTAAVNIYKCAPLRVVLARVRLKRGGQDSPAPTFEDAFRIIERARHMLPCPYTEVLSDRELVFKEDIATDDGVASLEREIMGLAKGRDDAGDAIYCAVLPAHVWIAGGIAGFGREFSGARGLAVFPVAYNSAPVSGSAAIDAVAAATAAAADAAIVAHELGHACGRPHPWDEREEVFPDYPDGETMTVYDSALEKNFTSNRNGLGQWGVAVERHSFDGDTLSADVFRPCTSSSPNLKRSGELMSYRHLRRAGQSFTDAVWPSPYTYKRLMQVFDLDPVKVSRPVGEFPSEEGRPPELKASYLFICGKLVVGADGPDLVHEIVAYHADVWPHASLRASVLSSGDLVDMSASKKAWIAALDHEGETLAAASVGLLQMRPGVFTFSAAVPFPSKIKCLSLRSGGRELWRTTYGKVPEIEYVSAEHRPQGVRVSWKATGAVQFGLAVSWDEGRTWQRLAGWHEADAVLVPSQELGRGGRALFRVFAHDGLLATSWKDSTLIPLPAEKGRIVPMLPLVDNTISLPAEIRLRLSAHLLRSDNSSRSSAEHDGLRWSSSLLGEIGTGRVIEPSLCAGVHRVTICFPPSGESCEFFVVSTRCGLAGR